MAPHGFISALLLLSRPGEQIMQATGDGNASANANANAQNNEEQCPFHPSQGPTDIEPMVYTELTLYLNKTYARPPTRQDIHGLICQVNDFFKTQVKNHVYAGTRDLVFKAVYINWYFYECDNPKQEDVLVTFLSYVYSNETSLNFRQVPEQDVKEAMNVPNYLLPGFTNNFIKTSKPEGHNVFFSTKTVNLATETGGVPPSTGAMLVEANCDIDYDAIAIDSTTTQPLDSLDDTEEEEEEEEEHVTLMPTNEPGQTYGSAQIAEIEVTFLVSNLENTTSPQAVNVSGLLQSFPVFANEVIRNMTMATDTETGRSLQKHHQRRQLRLAVVPNSARVESLQEYPCPSNALTGLTCHSAEATYHVLVTSDENKGLVQRKATERSQVATEDGTYNTILQRVYRT